MQLTKKHWIGVGIGVLVVFAVMNLRPAKAPVLPVPDTTSTSTTTPVVLNKAPITQTVTEKSDNQAFSISAADAPIWTFTGAYTGNAVSIKQAQDDIAYLTGLLGKGQYDDYDLYNGIANDYDLIGDGKSAYENYNRAIAIHPKKGLAFVNLAHLMDEVHAPRTAVAAYAKAVQAEPGALEYHVERLTYLTEHFGNDNTMILAAITDASKQFGDTPAILAIEAKWLTDGKRYADAIKAWQVVKMLSPENRQAAIDTEIARLQAKQ